MDWFCLKHSLSSSASSTRHLDPDGTFQQHTERIYEDILLSLRLLSAELILGLIFLHRRGIVHLDIKLGNISVTPTGHVQICNFAVAVALPNLLPRQPGPDLSELGSVNSRSNAIMDLSSDFDCEAGRFGTITLDSKAIVTSKYAPPELLEPDDQGRIVFDTKADWWGLGSVLLELAYSTEDQSILPGEGDFVDFLHRVRLS
jgi:serine/threonine protein kinase